MSKSVLHRLINLMGVETITEEAENVYRITVYNKKVMSKHSESVLVNLPMYVTVHQVYSTKSPHTLVIRLSVSEEPFMEFYGNQRHQA